MKMKPKQWLALAGLCAMTACSKAPSAASVPTPSAENPGSLLASPKITSSPQIRPAPDAAVLAPTPDRSVPLDRYTDLNGLQGGQALSYVVTAKATTPLSPDERLDRLSSSYHAEHDVFKRQEIAKTELPRVDATLDEYRKQAYYTLPITSYSTQALALTNVTLGPYQPASHSFPLTSYGNRCWAGVVRNQQGAVLHLDGNGPSCNLSVPDEAAARAIEAARATQTLHVDGTAYVFVPQADKGAATGSVAAAKIVLSNGPSKSPLGEFALQGS